MTRLLLAACIVALAVGCAQAISSTSAGSTPTCGSHGTPPAPRIEAVQAGQRVLVEYSVQRPAGCVADAVQIAVSSLEHPGNVGPSPTNGLIRLTGSNGTVELDLPALDLPPYEVRATSLTPRGRRSAVTALRLPHSGNECRGERCLQRAQEKLERCLRGQAARKGCAANVWRTRPPVPYEAVRGVTRHTLQKSFASLIRNTGQGEAVHCSSNRECVVTWQSDEGGFSALFQVSGYGERAGCWVAERELRLDDLFPARLRGCVDWEWNQ